MASTRPASLSSRPESLAIIQPLNRAAAAASIADTAETRVKVSMPPESYHLAAELAAERVKTAPASSAPPSAGPAIRPPVARP